MFYRFRKKFIGDRAFYKMVLAVAVPIMIQNGITNFVGLLDNIMIGQVGTAQMSGVAIVNQLLMVYYLCIFGGLAGAGIFTAQYFGQKDDEGVRQTFRYKIWMALVLTVIAIIIFVLYGRNLIQMYLTSSGDVADVAAALYHGRNYLLIMLLGIPAFMIVQVYVSTLRECGETVVPLRAGVIAVFVNLVFNYLLIYGKFGLPELGVAGAAVATVISRYVEAAIVIAWTHMHTDKNPYIIGVYRTLRVPGHLAVKFLVKGSPLLINESLWSAGVAMLTQCYSVRGLDVIAGLNIANTLNNLFNIVFIAMGDAVAIIIGQLLGAGKMEEARDTDNKIIAFSVLSCIGIALLMAAVAPFFPQIYNTTDEVRLIALQFILAQAVFMPQAAFMHASYFTLRSGGRTIITFLFDSVFMWCVSIPLAFCLSRFTAVPVIVIFVMVQVADWIKCAIGFVLVKKGVWLNNIVTS